MPLAAWLDEIEVMKSLARPKKLALKGSDGQIYMFLGKPKDDLRKDARLMDLNAIINKLLKANTESRRRQLCALLTRLERTSLIHCRRHPDLWCCHFERRMRLHSMGAEYSTNTADSQPILRETRCQGLGKL